MARGPVKVDACDGDGVSVSPRVARDLLVERLTAAQFAGFAPAAAAVHREIGEREIRATVIRTMRLLFEGLGLDWRSPTSACLVTAIRHMAECPREWGLADPAAAGELARIMSLADQLECQEPPTPQ